VIVDGSSTDSDTLTITATNDISAKPTIAGIETIVFNLDASSTTTGTTFAVATDNIDADKIVVDVTKVGSTVTAASVTAVATDTTIETDLALTVSADSNADITINATKGTSQTINNVTGTLDTLTINGSAATLLTLSDAAAEEAVTITNTGGVTVSALTGNTTTAATTLDVTAGGAVTISSANKGIINATTSSGNINLLDGDAATGNVTLTAEAGNVKVTTADTSTGTLTVTAAGDITNSNAGTNGVAGDDGDILITSAAAFKTVVLNATGGADTADVAGATSLTVTAGEESDLAGTAAVKTLTLASNNADGTKFISGTGSTNLNAVDNIVITGSNDVTLVVDASDLVAAKSDTSGSTTAQAVIATDNSTATSRISIAEDIAGTTVDASKLAVDEIGLAADNTVTGELTIASGANVVLESDQTAVILGAAAVAGNTATLTIEDDSSLSDTNAYQLAALTSTNIATLTVQIDDTEQVVSTNTYNVGAANALKIAGAGSNTIATSVVAASLDASDMSGVLDIQLQKQATVAGAVLTVTGGSGNDVFTQKASTDIDAYVLDGGDGVDVFEFQGDYSSTALSLTNIEKATLQAAADVRAADFTGKTMVVTGSFDLDLKAGGTGATVDASNIDKVASTLTITGGAGADTLTASTTSATTINAGGSADNVIGGGAADILKGEGGNDVITTGNGADYVDGGAGTDSIDLTEATAAADEVEFSVGASTMDTVTGFSAGGATANDNISALTATFSFSNTGTGGAGTALAVSSAATMKAADTADDDATVFTISTDVAAGTFADYKAGSITEATMEAAVATALGVTGTGLSNAANDVVLVLVDDGADTGVFVFTAADATDNATGTAEIEIGMILNGVADATSIVAADILFA